MDALTGVPYYKEMMMRYQAEAARLRQLVAAYENGKFMRLMRALHRLRTL
jgi:hypothetical protein